MTFRDIFEQHDSLQRRKASSQVRLDEARQALANEEIFQRNPAVCVFAAGSLGRLECGATSDLDVFVTTAGEQKVGRLLEIETFASIVKVNNELRFPELSNDGQFLSVFNVTENEIKVGSPVDDTENWFTTRMLLLLESNFLCNSSAYDSHKQTVLDFYLRDRAQEDFRPVFLLNDILRYWRTLCLNYERARSIQGKSWKKRNLNLRFSRLLTVFGTILPLMLEREVTTEKIKVLTSFTPMERLAMGLDLLEDAADLQAEFGGFLDCYEEFLRIKETHDFDKLEDNVRAELKQKADYVAEFIFRALNHPSVPQRFRRYLVI
jgi:predicted nucleotidyltransferase